MHEIMHSLLYKLFMPILKDLITATLICHSLRKISPWLGVFVIRERWSFKKFLNFPFRNFFFLNLQRQQDAGTILYFPIKLTWIEKLLSRIENLSRVKGRYYIFMLICWRCSAVVWPKKIRRGDVMIFQNRWPSGCIFNPALWDF